MQTDVAIIGAGPAGAVLGALLAGRGVATVVIDRDVFPRDKLCGEFLSWDALPILKRLGVVEQLDRLGAPYVRVCRIHAASTSVEFDLPMPARGISRLSLDAILLAAATRAGATRMDGWTASMLETGRIAVTNESASHEIQSRVVAGAWGRWGRFDQQLQRPFVRERSRRYFGFKRHYKADGSNAGSIDLYPFRAGYLGVNDVEQAMTNICGLVHADRLAGHKGGWERFVANLRAENPALEALFARCEPLQDGFLSSDPVIFRPRAPVEGGVFMIGDASGVIDPLTGNGMAMAIQSALLAAEPILRTLETPARRLEMEAAYARAHAGFFGRRISWSRSAAAILSRPRLLSTALRLPGSGRVARSLSIATRASVERVERLADRWFC